jgi:hypothetical protein
MDTKLTYVTAAFMAFSCNKKKDDSDDEGKIDICALADNETTKDLTICTDEFIADRSVDGEECYYKICPTLTTGECPTYFIKTKSSTTPTEKFCSYSRPTEL